MFLYLIYYILLYKYLFIILIIKNINKISFRWVFMLREHILDTARKKLLDGFI